MDQGWAAVIAGAAGAGGAGFGAWATGRAMIKQVREQARDRHAHWLLEQRQEAYTGMLAAHDAFLDELRTFKRVAAEQRESDSPGQEAWRQTNDALSRCGRAMRRVEVVGPEDVATLAMALFASLTELRNAQKSVNDLPPADQMRAWMAATRLRQVAVREFGQAVGEVITSRDAEA